LAKKQDSLESKLSAFLKDFETTAADLKGTAADLKLLGSVGGGTANAHWSHCLAMLKLPTRPEDEDEARALYWDDLHCTATSNSSRVSTPSVIEKAGKRINVPGWAVEGNLVQVSVPEWERARRCGRNQISAIEKIRSIVPQWLMNDSETRGYIKVRMYMDVPWLALASGDHKLDKIMGPLFSEHFSQKK
jgi:hypothetical protein